MSELHDRRINALTVKGNQILYALPTDNDEVIYTTDERYGEIGQEPINLAGIWADLDGDAMLEARDRMGREAPPTPPIVSIA